MNGVLQTAQKYSASSGVGELRHSSQTGTRVHLRRARSQTRQLSGKNSEKIPWGIPRTRWKAAVLAIELLEKAHLLSLNDVSLSGVSLNDVSRNDLRQRAHGPKSAQRGMR